MWKFAAVLLLLATPAMAQDGVKYYNKMGIYEGSSKWDGDRYVYRNNMGVTTGWDKVEGNQVKHYNNMGIYQGSSRRN